MLRGHSLGQTVKQSISSNHDLKGPSSGGGIRATSWLQNDEKGSVLPPARSDFHVLKSKHALLYSNPSRHTGDCQTSGDFKVHSLTARVLLEKG